MPPSRSAREDAPRRHVFRALFRAAREKVKPKFRDECAFIVATAGLLGLRGGEICHMTREWVDLDRGVIYIPRHDPCTKADGDPCGYCHKRVRSAIEHDDGLTYEEALAQRWQPKMEASSRPVWYDWSDTLVRLYDDFFTKYDRYKHSRVSINRRVDMVAEACELIEDTDDVYPHALRGHAARYHAQNGMRVHQLTRFMGWENLDSALPYIKMESGDVREALHRAHEGRGGVAGLGGGDPW